MNKILEINHLKKRYKKNFILKGIDLEIDKGDILGLIGKNGAGKTTLLKCINELISYSGTIKHHRNIRIGALIEEPGLLPYFSGAQNLRLIYNLHGINPTNEEVNNLMSLVKLKNDKRKVKAYSLGMKQRLGIAMTLIGNPEIILLDEPTNGLDPDGIILLRKLILKLNQKGVTFIISSHMLDELAKISKKVAFINNGKVIHMTANTSNLEKLFIKYIVGEENEI